MRLLSDDDLDLRDLSDEELAAAFDLWFDLARATNGSDESHTHGVFVPVRWKVRAGDDAPGGGSPGPHSAIE